MGRNAHRERLHSRVEGDDARPVTCARTARGPEQCYSSEGATPIGNGYTVEWRVMMPGPALAPEPREAPNNVIVLKAPAEDEALIVAIGLGPVGGTKVPRCSDAVSYPLAKGWLSNGMSVW